jgi:hypothetical protein
MMAAQPLTTADLPPDLHPHASRYIHFHGREILRGVGLLRGSVIKCPDGHEMNEGPVQLLEDGVLFCDKRIAGDRGRHHAQCGALVYALALPSRGGRRRFFLADLTKHEWHEIKRLELDADGIMHYFGATFPR